MADDTKSGPPAERGSENENAADICDRIGHQPVIIDRWFDRQNRLMALAVCFTCGAERRFMASR